MKTLPYTMVTLTVLVGCYLFFTLGKNNQAALPPTPQINTAAQNSLTQNTLTQTTMKLTSTAFENNGTIPSKYTCDGENINPPLQISDVPTNTESLILIVDDPDAPGGDWVHWIVLNIKPQTREIKENGVLMDTVKGTNSFGKIGWGGPCPPSGAHHYQFKLYALDTGLNMTASSKKADVEKAMEGHVLEQTMLVGVYERK